jgi:hypothetical protein
MLIHGCRFSNDFFRVITEAIGLNSVKDLIFVYESEEILKVLKENVKPLEYVKFTRIKESIGSLQSGEKPTPETERGMNVLPFPDYLFHSDFTRAFACEIAVPIDGTSSMD